MIEVFLEVFLLILTQSDKDFPEILFTTRVCNSDRIWFPAQGKYASQKIANEFD